MLIQEDNPGIDFEYSMPSGAVKAPGDDRYVCWQSDRAEFVILQPGLELETCAGVSLLQDLGLRVNITTVMRSMHSSS